MKNMIRCIIGLFLSALCFFAGGCSVNGTITDFNKKSTDVSNVRLDGPGTLTILDGDAILEVPVKKIAKVDLQCDITKTYNRVPHGSG